MLRSPQREAILGPNTPFCNPYIGKSAVDRIPVTNNIIGTNEFYEPIAVANQYGAEPVNQALAAMSGLHRLLVERSKSRETLIATFHYGEWENPHVQALRAAIYTMIGSTDEHPQRVRDDIAGGELDGTIITKGQAGPHAPLFLVEKSAENGGRHLEVIDGRPKFMSEVMSEVNAFSPDEYGGVEAYVMSRTTDPAFSRRLLSHANRYTVPTWDALYGAFQCEAYGSNAVSAWGPEFNVYPKRKENPIPE